MELPYSIEVFFAAMARYNAEHLSAVGLNLALSLAAVGLALWRRADEPQADRTIGAVLAVGWIWVGAVHQLGLMADLNFMASVYGPVWILEGALLALVSLIRPQVRFRFAGDGVAWGGLVVALLGLAAYPLAIVALGFDWRAVPLAGSAPHPTVLLTAGLLALAGGPRWLRLGLMVLPLAWGGVAALAASLLAFPLDYAVTAAVAAAAGLVLLPRPAERAAPPAG